MIRQLMKLDGAWLWLPFIMMASVFVCALGGNFAFWNMLLIASVIAADRQPDTQLHAALPMTVRPVLVARSLSVLALIWVPLATGWYFLVARKDSGVTIPAVAAFGSAITLVAVWIQTTRILGRRRGSSWLVAIPFAIWTAYACTRPQLSDLFSGWGAWLLRVSAGAGIPMAVTCTILTAGLLVWGFVCAPDSFPVEIGEMQEATSSVKASKHPARTLIRIAFSFSYLWLLFFVLSLVAALRLTDTGVFAGVFLVTAWSSIRRKLPWISFLPVSPGVLVAMILLPALAAVAGGYTLGIRLPVARLPWLKTEGGAGITLPALSGCGRLNVVPQVEFLLPVVGGKPPGIESPWGETVQPLSQRVDGVKVYNPWAVGCDNSERFFDWQFSRASGVVYGRQVPRDQLGGAHSVLSPLAIPGLRAQIFSIISLAAVLMPWPLISMAEDWWRIRLVEGGKLLIMLAIVPCAVLPVVQNYIARWAAWTFPASLPVATAMAMVPVGLIYWATSAMFRRLEFVDKPTPGERT